jgi:hypothetical protein
MTDLTYEQARQERRALKQKLFYIRRAVAGEPVQLNSELRELKTQYEALPGFTTWLDFPEKWEIGDPHNTKISAPQFNDVDKANQGRVLGKPYLTIIHLTADTDGE